VIILPPFCSPPWNPSRVSLIIISARTLNKYGERTQPCQTPFLTRNHSDSVPTTLTLASCFLFSMSSKSNLIQRISHVHHSQPELIMGDRVKRLLDVYKAHIQWLLMLTCLVHQYSGRAVASFEFHIYLWRHKTRVTWLSCGVVCVILRLVILVEYRLVTDRRTDKHTITGTRIWKFDGDQSSKFWDIWRDMRIFAASL